MNLQAIPAANFRELRACELRRIPLLRLYENSG
jgi:hypothetical protein